MLAEEQESNSHYFYELASGRFGYSMDKVKQAQAFHFICGQGAKTGTGGHLPGNKVNGKIAEVRDLQEGQAAVSPARFPDWDNIEAYRDFAAEVRESTDGIPIGVRLSAQHIERDIEAALHIGVDYIILDGRGSGAGAATLLFRDNISVPTIPALARAQRYLNKKGCNKVLALSMPGGIPGIVLALPLMPPVRLKYFQYFFLGLARLGNITLRALFQFTQKVDRLLIMQRESPRLPPCLIGPHA